MDNKKFILAKTDEEKYDVVLSQFKVGDVVRICKKIRSYSEGWDNVWVDEMDDRLNHRSTICDIAGNRRGIGLSFDDSLWDFYFPPQALEKL